LFKGLDNIGFVGIIKGLVYAGLLTGIYYTAYTWLIVKDWAREDYSASMLIPLVVLYLIWDNRGALAARPSKTSWLGLGVMFAGVALFWLGELAGEFFTLYFSSWLTFTGLCWLHLGWRKLKTIAFPILLLLAMFPLPNFIHGKLSFNLKLISSQMGVKMMQWLGMSAFREGNVIDLGFTQLQVVDACNGLRYLIPLIILGLIIAYFFKTVWWKRVLLVVSTIPIAVFVNSLRITSVGILYPIWGPKVAEGFFHDFSGWFIFILTVGFLAAVMGILKLLPPKQVAKANPAMHDQTNATAGLCAEVPDSEVSKPQLSRPFTSKFLSTPFMAACCLLGLNLAIAMGVEFHATTPMIRPFSEFPASVAGWQGKRSSMEQKFITELDLSDYTIINYLNQEDRSVNFYVAYYQSQSKGESIHSPATCLPGGGWEFEKAGTTQIPVPYGDKDAMPVNRAFMQKGDTKQLSYFWFPMRGRVATNMWEMKLFNFWDALTRQRTDGALVRLITPLYEDEDVQDADQRLVAFTREIVPILSDFLPQ